MNSPAIEIGSSSIGEGYPCFIIAEAGVNHNGEIRTAEGLVDAASRAGADAVKFQTFKADRLASRDAPKAQYQKDSTDRRESQMEMLRQLELSHADHERLKNYATNSGILFLSTPFDEESADFLDNLGVPLFKIGSGDLTNHPLLRHVSQKNKPVILSTGMAYLDEVREAVTVVRGAGCDEIVILQCTSNYPSDIEDCNLRAMLSMRDACGAPVGYSDHTIGFEAALGAVSLGAVVLEKHLTLDKSMPGPDHTASAEPDEFKTGVQSIRKLEKALGSERKRPSPAEMDVRRVARRSIVAAQDLPRGTALKTRHLVMKRPGTGIPPSDLDQVLGKTLIRAIGADEIIRLTDLQ